MKIIITESDIYDIRINDAENFEFNKNVTIDNVNCDRDITISISGECTDYGYHDPITCKFDGKLTMDSDDFAYTYTNLAKDGYKYIEFEGTVDITTSDKEITIDDSVINETLYDTIYNIERSYCNKLADPSEVTCSVIENAINDIKDINKEKIINEIKNLDNIDISENDLYNFLKRHVIDEYSGDIIDEKYNSVASIVFDEFKELIKRGEIENTVNYYLGVISAGSGSTYDITAKVFFSNLDL